MLVEKKQNSQSPENVLRQFPLFRNCSDGFFAKIAQQAHTKLYSKSHLLFTYGLEAETFYYIRSGWVKLYRETLDGTQAVVDILPAGHIFGETSLFENDVYPHSAEIVEEAEIISLPLGPLKKEIETNGKLAFDMLHSMAVYRRQQEREIEHRALQNAPQRIGCFLLRLIDQENTGPSTIHLPYDKMLLASRLGMQPETFSRALSKLKDQTGITIKGSTIEVEQLSQLSEYACSACSSEFPCKDLTGCKSET